MAIQESKKQSDLEKRLKLLRRQVYGKEFRVQNEVTTNNESQTINSSSDLTYLNQDLLKILIFASIAIVAQIILLFFSKNHIVNLNLF